MQIALKNVVCEMMAILSRGDELKSSIAEDKDLFVLHNQVISVAVDILVPQGASTSVAMVLT